MNKNFLQGWYYFTASAQIKKNKVYTFNYFDTSFVCYRDSKNSINVFDAYCPHLGAHLGVGGKIVNDLLVCPFHGWKYNATGQCVEISYCKKIPKRAKLQSYPVQEMNSLVFVYLDREDVNAKAKLESRDIDLLSLKKFSIKDFLTTRMKNHELQKIIEKAKTLFSFKPIGSGIFIVKSKHNHISLFVTATPVNSNEFSVSFSASIEKNFINIFRSFFIRKKAKRRFEVLFNTAVES
ncbi:MAG: Rieske (2Fe-2S) protein [Gammaproteobacteria bacterium]|nr:Rieske (2Fe-2S) protein [Gammaproteobacteria bacterium]